MCVCVIRPFVPVPLREEDNPPTGLRRKAVKSVTCIICVHTSNDLVIVLLVELTLVVIFCC